LDHGRQTLIHEEGSDVVNPMTAAVAGAVISGVAMYAVGTRAQDAGFAEMPALVQTVDGQYVSQPIAYSSALRPVASPVLVQQQARPAARRTVTRTAPARERVVVREVEDVEEARDQRSWQKTALIIGGAAASGAGVGAVVDGKKGALIGAAIGGGAASIYEATRRR
jgi:hypothetical protein